MVMVKEETLDTHLIHLILFSYIEGWITKGCDSRISWIGVEGLPFRDQVREKREQRT
jgi:hypothetical protein